MAALRFALTLFALLAAAGASRAGHVEPAAMAGRAARYYASGLQAPLLEIRAATQIVATCQRRFRARCSKPHREAADRAGLTLEYLDALSLFPERLSADPTSRMNKYADVVIANEFLFQAATELELIVNPDARALFDAFAPRIEPGKSAPQKSGFSLRW
jgi:hypothetical protein